MNRTYMQKGIGAAPFAIVAALIVALTVGFWATQPAQAADGDITVEVADVTLTASGQFVDPDTDDTAEEAYGPAGIVVESRSPLTLSGDDSGQLATEHQLEKAYAAANGANQFRGEIARRGSWVEIGVWVDARAENAATAVVGSDAFSVSITLTGEAEFSSGLTTATVTSQPTSGERRVQFAVYSTGTPGDFSVAADKSSASALTTTPIKKAGSLNGQWVGSATTVTVLNAAPATTGSVTYATKLTAGGDTEDDETDDVYSFVDANGDVIDSDPDTDGLQAAEDGSAGTADGLPDDAAEGTLLAANGVSSARGFGAISAGSFRAAANPGLETGEVGFLFQLTDSAGQVALNTDAANGRDDVFISVTTDRTVENKKFTIADALSSSSSDDQVYVEIQQESALQDPGADTTAGNDDDPAINYPVQTTGAGGSTGGLIAVALSSRAAAEGGAGRICVDVDDNGTCEAEVAFEAAGTVDGSMSSVGPATGDLHLGNGGANVRTIMVRDAAGVPINNLTMAEARAIIVTDTSKPGGGNLVFAFGDNAKAAMDAADNKDAEDDANGANPARGSVPSNPATDGTYYLGISTVSDAIGAHSFTVTIGTGTAKATKTVDTDGNPLEAHRADSIKGLAVTSVTNGAGEELLSNGAVTSAPYDLLTITLAATGSDGAPPQNGSPVTSLSGTSGFVGAGSTTTTENTDNAGEVTFSYGAGDNPSRLSFSGGSASATLLVRIAAEGAAVDDGPSIYSLVGSAGSTYVSWNGGDASSSVFENVAGLVIVWKWTGSMWVGYTSSPSAPAATKTVFGLSDGDVLYVVSNGPVDVELD